MLMRIFLIISILGAISATKFECEFHEWTGWGYGCRVTKGTIKDRRNATVEEITGEHMEDKNNTNVVWVSIESLVVNYFPKNLALIFPNLTTIYLAKSQLREIQLNDFTTLEKLKNLFLDSNEIAKVDVRAFETLSKLRSLSFDYNKCHSNSVYYNRTAVLSLIGEIKAKCDINKITTNAPITTAAVEAIKEKETVIGDEDEDIEMSEMEMLQAKIVKLENQVKEIPKLRATIENYEQQIVEIAAKNERLKTNEEQLYELQKESQVLKKELSQRNRDIANLKSENANLGTRVTRCNSDNGQFRIQIRDLKSENENLKNKITTMEKEMDEVIEITEKLSNCRVENGDLELKIENLSFALEKSQLKFEELTSTKDKLRAEISNYTTKISSLEADVESLKMKLQKCESSKSDHLTILENLQTERETCDEKMSNKESQIEDLRGNLRALENKMENLQVDLKNCKTGLSNYDAQLLKLINDNTKLKANVTLCSTQSSGVLEEKSQKCNEEILLISSENENLLAKIENARKEISSMTEMNENLQSELTLSQQEISTISAKNENLQTELSSIKIQVNENSNSQITKLKLENQDLILKVSECDTAITNFRFQLTNIKSENSHVRSLLANCENEKAQVANDCDILGNEKLSILKDEHEKLLETLAQNDAKISTLLIDNESLKARFVVCDQHVTDNERLRSTLSACDSEFARCDMKLTRTALENENLQASLSNFEIRLMNLVGENQRLAQTSISSIDLENLRISLATTNEAQISNLLDHNEKLSIMLSKCDAEIYNLNDEIRTLEIFQEQVKDYAIQTENLLEKCRANNIWCFNTYCGGRNNWNQ